MALLNAIVAEGAAELARLDSRGRLSLADKKKRTSGKKRASSQNEGL